MSYDSMKDWELDDNLRTLERAEEIRNDLAMMSKLELHLKEKQENFVSIEKQLFGPDKEETDNDQAD